MSQLVETEKTDFLDASGAHASSRRPRGRTAGGWLLAVGVLTALSGCGHRDGAAEAQAPTGAAAQGAQRAPVEVTVATAVARTEPETLDLDGTLVADEESNVTSVVAGRVMEVFVERGARVEAGDRLVRLRDVDYRLQAAAARAQLEQAAARLGMERPEAAVPRADQMPDVLAARSEAELAQANLARSEELGQRGVLSAQALDEARSRAASARERQQTALNNARASVAALASARTTLSQATTSASEAVVRAPFSGEVVERTISVGEYVSPQTSLLTLVRIDPLRIELQIPQQHLGSVREGLPVELHVDAYPGRAFPGTVRYVSAAIRRDTRGLVVEAVVPNHERELRPGLFVSARITVGATRDVVSIPPSAVLSEAGVDRAFVVRDGVIDEHVISIARRTADEVVVGDGLASGDQVVTSALDQLADGVPVHVTGSAEAAAPTEVTGR